MLYKRPNSRFWWCKFTAPDGTRIQRSTKTVDRRQAREFEDRLKASLWRITQLGDKPRRSWKESVVRWFQETQKKSIEGDKLHLKWASPYLESCFLDEIDRDLLDRISHEKLKTGVQPATVNRLMEVIRAILNKAEREWGWIERAPAVRMLRERARRIRWITKAEADRLLDYLPRHLNVMARFTLATGLREANVTGLEWSQVDLARQVAWIHGDQSKSGKPIGIPLNKEAMVILRGQQGLHAKSVFTFRGKTIKKCNTKAWRKALRAAEIDDFRWHDLRHTWASWHVQSGTPIHVLQELGGWSDIRMVQRYAHLAPEHLLEYANRLCVPKIVTATFSATHGS